MAVICMQLAFVIPVQQVGEAMVELADHQQHLHRLCGAVELPLHREVVGDAAEVGA
jgi:hypothetical protein